MCIEIISGNRALMPEGQHEHRQVITQRDTDRLEPDFSMQDGDEFISWAVAVDIERGDGDPEVSLEPRLLTEEQFTDA
ncbi:hypothetical protein GCM10009689_02740 [Brevibacterium antiquum]